MLLVELFENVAWAKSGNNVVRKYRCSSGIRKGRVVASPGECSAPIDQKKRMILRRTMAKMAARIARKAKRTKRLNPVSRRVRDRNLRSKR